jgi:hypothetical protein
MLEESGALCRLELKRLVEHTFDLLPALGSHANSLRLNSRCNHSRAVAHSRLTVAGDTSNTC